MKLNYRGNSYDVEPVSVELTESHVTGQYRGQTFQFSYPRHIPVPQPALNLKYRGIPYRTSAEGIVSTANSVQTAPAVERRAMAIPDVAPLSTARRAALAEVAKVHRQNIERNLQHRLEVAQQKGDQALIRLLEQEMRQLA